MNKIQTLSVNNVVAGYNHKVIVNTINLTIPSKKISVIIGANACGKSTLLKTIARLISPYEGTITLDEKCVHNMPQKHLAKQLGILPQSPIVPEGITVFDLVSRGRFPHQTFFKGLCQTDLEAIHEAMEIMGIVEIANQSVDELSGGQRQRVWIAMALAQQTDYLLLDEPTTFLDIAYQVEILDLLTDLNRKRGTTIVMVLHDINLSARYADHIFAMQGGQLIAQGRPCDIINEDLIHKVFDLSCTVINDPISSTPFIVPKGRHHIVRS